MTLPILYSHRRCPYAMRARMALKLANIDVEIREIALRNKPAHMLQASPKATVPVLLLPDGKVIDESLEVIYWALKEHPLIEGIDTNFEALVLENDQVFKRALDAYKYPERQPHLTQLEHRAQGEIFLQKLENLLQKNQYIHSTTLTLADIAIFPFVRQFAAVDKAWFAAAPYPKLQAWLQMLVESTLFVSVMEKQPTYIE